MIPKETVDKIFDAADIYDVVKDYVNLKKSGANYKGNCPFHNEKTPSFMVSPAKGIYKCFGCGAAGNTVKFVMEHEKVSFPEALKILAKKYHIEIVEEILSEEQTVQKQERDSLLIVTEFAKNFFIHALHQTDEGKQIALSYYKERGFTEDIIKKFELGWSPSKKNALTETAVLKGYKINYLEETGLTVIKKETNYQFDRFAERIIFPIHTLSGKVTAFGGRTLKNDKNNAKYLNSPESEIYHKSKTLYGIYFAKTSIVKYDKCFMVEGYTDVISMHRAGIENVVASSGTALTVDQIKLVRRFTKNLSIIYDGDTAGIKASLRGIDLVLAEEMNLKIVLLPHGEDPDSFARKQSSENLINFINEHEQDFIEFKTKLLAEEAKTDPVKRAQLVMDVVKSIAIIPDTILRAEYIKTTALQLNVKEEVIYEEIRKILLKNFEDGKYKSINNLAAHAKEPKLLPVETGGLVSVSNEKEIIWFLLNFGNESISYDDDSGEHISVAEFIINEIKNESLEFQNVIYKEIFQEYDQYFSSKEESPLNYFLNHPNEKVSSIVAEIISPKKELSKLWEKKGGLTVMPEQNLHESVPEAIERFKLQIVNQKIKEINIQISNLKPEEYDTGLKPLLETLRKMADFKIELIQFTEKSALI